MPAAVPLIVDPELDLRDAARRRLTRGAMAMPEFGDVWTTLERALDEPAESGESVDVPTFDPLVTAALAALDLSTAARDVAVLANVGMASQLGTRRVPRSDRDVAVTWLQLTTAWQVGDLPHAAACLRVIAYLRHHRAAAARAAAAMLLGATAGPPCVESDPLTDAQVAWTLAEVRSPGATVRAAGSFAGLLHVLLPLHNTGLPCLDLERPPTVDSPHSPHSSHSSSD